MKTQLIYITKGTTLKGKPVAEKTVQEVGEDVGIILISQEQAEPYDPAKHKDAVISKELKSALDSKAKADSDSAELAKKK